MHRASRVNLPTKSTAVFFSLGSVKLETSTSLTLHLSRREIARAENPSIGGFSSDTAKLACGTLQTRAPRRTPFRKRHAAMEIASPNGTSAVFMDCGSFVKQQKFECSLSDLIESDEPTLEEEDVERPRYVPPKSLSEVLGKGGASALPSHLRRLPRPEVLPTIASIASLCGSSDQLRRPSVPLLLLPCDSSGLFGAAAVAAANAATQAGNGLMMRKKMAEAEEDDDLEVEYGSGVEEEDEEEDEEEGEGEGRDGAKRLSQSLSLSSFKPSMKRWMQKFTGSARRSLRRTRSTPDSRFGTPRMSMPEKSSERTDTTKRSMSKDDLDLSSIVMMPWD